ncbi:related to AMD2 - acetamidase [Ustilago sp. UG-2017b]|nr:related to AMD2 - acetamidase [Ustilago sp. UG-2017b]
MADYIHKAEAQRAARDASIPLHLLSDLSSASVPPLPHEPLPLPHSKSEPHKPEPTAIYDTLNATLVPAKLLSLEDNAITTTALPKLVDLLSTGKLSSVRCTEAFLCRAVLAHQLVNCCTDFFPDLALARAKECDEHLAKHGKPIGPLYGLPISLKDQFHIQDTKLTMGYVGWIDRPPAKSHSVITQVMLRAGAVLYVRTSIPQSLMRCETHNHIYGRTLNPFNRSFTPGGSSGGEGALVGMHGSPLGLGADIGGSVRVPSAFNGLWGCDRASNAFFGRGGDVHASCFGGETLGTGSPFGFDAVNEDAYSLKDLQLKKGSTASQEPLGQSGKLCFAILWDDGVIRPHPPITRALRETKEKLISAGHAVIDWIPHDHLRAYDIISRIYTADGGEDIRRSCAEGGEPVMFNLMADGKEHKHRNTFESWQLNQEKTTEGKTGTGRPVDAIIAPWNLLDRPCVVFPVGYVDPSNDKKEKLEKPYQDLGDGVDQMYWDRYEPEEWANLPINLQVVGKRLQDEELLGIAKVIRDAGATLH